MIRLLGRGDEAELESFLSLHEDSSMFLRSNALAGGLVDRAEPLQGTWAAAFEDTRIVGVACHAWTGTLLVQAPRKLEEIARAAVSHSGRKLRGISGPSAQVETARAALGRAQVRARFDEREWLYALDFPELVIPPALSSGEVICRRPLRAELGLCAEWRAAYILETGLEADGPSLRAAAYEGIELWHQLGNDFVLEKDSALVAYAGFNARLPDMVQSGGVYTPPELRGRGHARCAVAGSLLAARPRRAVLFTPQTNLAAQQAYAALGYRRVGDFGLVIFAT